jgi:serpin B
VNAIKVGLDYDLRNLDLQSPTALGEINGWVKRETNDKIPSILEQMPRGALMVLTSALYYKAPWVQKMTVYDVPISFGATGTKQQVKSMGMNGEFAYLDAPTYRALVVPFKGDGVAEFYVPKGEHTPEHIAATALAETTAMRVQRVRLRMPMWKVEYYESVKEPLMKAGLAPLFEPRDEFRPIAPDVWVLDAFHRTWVDMNENGVEAAAATAVVVGRTSAPIGEPIDFTIDRPFFVVIRKKTTGAALFMGFIHKPTAF